MDYGHIQGNIEDVRRRISKACTRVGRSPDEVTLIGVTKTHPAAAIESALANGIQDIAENRVQEILKKYDEVADPFKIHWHLIGHLQTNKVKYIIDKVDLIHSLDSMRLADELQKRAQAVGKVQQVLIQVNVADEKQKFGIPPASVLPFLEAVRDYPNLKGVGLMNIAPLVSDPEAVRGGFRQMKVLFDEMVARGFPMVHLSMGMTSDYEVAVEEGATLIRIGTGIFGARPYAEMTEQIHADAQK